MTLATWVVFAACASSGSSREPEAQGPLLTSLQVTTAGELVTFDLQVTNTSGDPIELNFSSGQSADFIVSRDGETIWRWSDEQAFTQALRSDVLEPGASRSYEAQWRPAAGLRGELEAVGRLTATGHRVEQAARFSLP